MSKSIFWRYMGGVAALLAFWVLPLPAAAEPAAEPATDERAAFDHFDQELKAAIRADNVAALAVLVQFPLRVNHGDGGVTSLGNPRALVANYAEVFTPAVRKAILDSKGDDFIFKPSEIGYAGGSLWVGQFPTEGEDSIFRVSVINLDDNAPDAVASKSLQLSFVCETTKHRILIEESSSDHRARYRVWNRPKSLLEPPDLELADGKADFEGTGVCATRFWEFHTGGVTIRAGELGCGPGDEPQGAVGDLTVTKKDGSEQRWYCF